MSDPSGDLQGVIAPKRAIWLELFNLVPDLPQKLIAAFSFLQIATDPKAVLDPFSPRIELPAHPGVETAHPRGASRWCGCGSPCWCSLWKSGVYRTFRFRSGQNGNR